MLAWIFFILWRNDKRRLFLFNAAEFNFTSRPHLSWKKCGRGSRGWSSATRFRNKLHLSYSWQLNCYSLKLWCLITVYKEIYVCSLLEKKICKEMRSCIKLERHFWRYFKWRTVYSERAGIECVYEERIKILLKFVCVLSFFLAYLVRLQARKRMWSYHGQPKRNCSAV